jgi:hypothetical protein
MIVATNFICYCWQRPRIYAGMELEFLLPGNRCQIYNKKFIVISIAHERFFCPKLLLKDAPLLIVRTSARLA